MTSNATVLGLRTQTEDALEHLPISGTTEYRKGQIIYGPEYPSNSIYLVVTGTVGISFVTTDGREVLLDIVPPDELFGESAFLGASRPAEIMQWLYGNFSPLRVAALSPIVGELAEEGNAPARTMVAEMARRPLNL